MKTKRKVLTGILCVLMALTCILSIVACGDENNEECAHEWGEWETTTSATCTQAGVETRVCGLNSEHTETRSVKAKGHTFGEYTSDENASCTADGTKTATCTECEETDTIVDVGSALEHDYSVSAVNEKYLKSEANCTDKAVYYKTCACGAISEEDTFEYGSVAHKYGTELEKDETHHWYECTECEEKSSVKAHNWDAGKVTKPATESKDGKKLFTCSDCGQTKEASIPKIGHVHTPVRTPALAATCETDGNIEYWYCASCDKYFSDANFTVEVFEENLVIPAIEHRNKTVELTVPAGCELPGYTTYACPDCDYTYDEEIPATGHAWAVSDTVEADCQTIGYTLHECSSCHEQKKTDVTPKTDCEETSEVTKEATCTENGEMTYTCSVCEGTRTETIAKSGHDYDDVVTPATCTTNGYTTHTCQNDGCESVYTDSVVLSEGHDWDTTTVAATCTVPGSKTSVCENCDEVETVVLDAPGHTWIGATCTADGYCDTCDAVGEPCHGHNYAEEIDNVSATCSANGYIEYACTYDDCDSTKRTTPDAYKTTGHNLAAVEWKAETVAVEGDCMFVNRRSGVCPDCNEPVTNDSEPFVKHTYVAAIKDGAAATCCSEGTKIYTCKDCQDSYEENYDIVADAHKWDEGVLQADEVTTLYTCAHDATHTKVSVSAKQNTSASINSSTIKESNDVELKNATFVPSDELKESIGDRDEVKLSADVLQDEEYNNAFNQLSPEDQERLAGGNIFNFTMEVNGSVQSSGLGGTMTVRIPYNLDKENGEDPEDIVVAYLNGNEVELKKATYMEIGEQGYAVFDTSHFSYYTVTKLTPAERCAIYGQHVEKTTVVPATCLTDGYTITVCLRCGVKEVKDEVPALGHDWKLNEDTYVEHSCAVTGIEEYNCSRCDVGYTVVTKAEGHNWQPDAENTYGATCTTAGQNAYKCDKCDGTYVEALAVLGHDFTVATKQPTCTEGGYTDKHCETCGVDVRTDFTKPLEHNIVDVVVPPTCVEKGYTAHYCDNDGCGQVFANTDEVPTAEHTWNIDAADCVTDKVCEICNTRGEKAHGHSMTKDGECEHCGAPCEHNYVLNGSIDSTCITRGYDVYVCSVCLGTHYDNYKDLADHDYAFVETVAPTCAKEGYDIHVCNNCKIKDYRNYTEKVEHKYVFSETLEATCTSPEYRVDECSECGKTKKTETAPATSHTFKDGKCTECGISSDLFYLSMLNAWADVKGVAIKLNNLSVIGEDLDKSFADGATWVEHENLTLINIAELMLYVDEDGKLCGAAHGSMSMVENVGMPATVYAIKAVIEGDNIYVEMSEETDGNTESFYLRASIEYIMSEMLAETGNGVTALASWAAVYVFPIMSSLNGESAEFVDNFVGSLINMFFTAKSSANGTVYTLDFDKLYALNENLADLTVGELVDTYFGDGFYDKLTADLEELLAVNVSDILDYLDEAGVPKDMVVEAVDALLAIAMGEEIGIEEMLASPELEGVTVKDMLSMMLEVEEIDIAAMMEELSSINVYEEMGSVEQAKAMVKSIIEMLEGSINISFTVDANGKTTDVVIDIDDFIVTESESYRVTLSVGLEIEIDGRIEVSWSGISDKIDGMVPEDVFVFDDEVDYYEPEIIYPGGGDYPDEEKPVCKEHYDKDMDGCCDYCGIRFATSEPGIEYPEVEYNPTDKEPNYEIKDENGKDIVIKDEVVYEDIKYTSFEIVDGTVEYKGEEYFASSMSFVQSRKAYLYSEIIAVMITEDCGDWTLFDLVFKTVRESVEYEMIYLFASEEAMAPNFILIYNEEVDEYIEISVDFENERMVALFPDGTVKALDIEMEMSELGEIYPDAWWVTDYVSSTSESVYYNSETEELEFESQHNYELDEEKSFEPTSCGDAGCEYYVCTECGDVRVYNYAKSHSYSWKYVLNENSETCEDGIDEIIFCVECGYVDHREEYVRFEHVSDRTITCENGVVYASSSCMACGIEMSSREKLYTLVTDENLVLDESGRYGSYHSGAFVFVPEESGIYELYTNGYGNASVRDDKGYGVGYGWLEDGLAIQLEAGVSYVIIIENVHGKAEPAIYFNARTVEEIDLADYGSDCGGKLIVTSHFLVAEVQLESNCAFEYTENGMQVCSECGFKFVIDEGYTTDEFCNEIAYCVYRFGKSEEDFNANAYELYSYKTGSVNHNIVQSWNNGQYETVDENGNTIIVNYSENIYTCESCHNVVDKSRSEYANDGSMQLWSKYYYYEWSSELGEIYISETNYTEYIQFVEADGSTQRVSFEEYCYYDEKGEATYWYRYDYLYEGCVIWEYYTNSYGETRVEQSFDHISRDNMRTERYESVDENGNKITVVIEVYEYSCMRCGEATSRSINTTHYDEFGNVVYEKEESYEYSYDSGELYLSFNCEVVYAIAYDVEGKPFSYRVSEQRQDINEYGEVYSTESYAYSYGENFCEAQVYYTSSYGKERYYVEYNHNHEWIYRLHEGATDCTEGLDYMRICLKCGDVTDLYENHSYNHIEEGDFFYEDGIVFRQTNCVCCDKILEEKREYASVDTDEELILSDRYDGLCFEFTPTVSGLYQFYSSGSGSDPYGYIYRFNGSWIAENDDRLEYMNFAMTAELTAGETYYLVVERSFKNNTLHFGKVEVEEIDLTEFGCGCGGSLVIEYLFGGKEAYVMTNCGFIYTEEFGNVCENCGFSYYDSHNYDYDEFCNEVETYAYYFKSADADEYTQYVIYSGRTGYSNHSTRWEEVNRYDETLDDDGKLIQAVEIYGDQYVCKKCNNRISANITTKTYDCDKIPVERTTERYEYSEALGRAYLQYTETYKWEKVATDYGFDTREVYYSYAYYNENGECTGFYSREDVYDAANPCRVVRTENNNGSETTETIYNHNESLKELPDECSDVWTTDDNGNEINVVTYAQERYCVRCFASLEKTVTVNTYDKNGNHIKYEEQRWGTYANSDTDFGFYLETVDVTEYGVLEYKDGEYATYVTKTSFFRYDVDKNILEGKERVYDYCYGNYCDYLVTVTPFNGESYTEEGRNHITLLSAVRLQDGASSCFDGTEYYHYCVGCDYDRVYSYGSSHENSQINPEIINTADYGSTCGGYVEIYRCPCGERAFVNTENLNCDMGSNWEWYNDGENKYDHYKTTYGCAVTDPEQCHFRYTVEGWYGYDEQCRATSYYIYTFGSNTDNPYVVSYVISSNYSSHSFEQKLIWSNEEEVNGLNVTTSYYESICTRCGHFDSALEDSFAYDADERLVEYIVKRYNSNRVLFQENISTYSYGEYGQVSRSETQKYYNDGVMTRKEVYEYVTAYARDGKYQREFVSISSTYEYDENGELYYWSENTYDYSNGYCRPRIISRDSYGNENVKEGGHNVYDWTRETVKPSTCTQSGLYKEVCVWCGEGEEYESAPHGHSYWDEYDPDNGSHYYRCYHCGLVNFNGFDGSVILEDLTADYGNGEELVMGYYFYGEKFDYIVAVSLVVEGVEEPVILDVFGSDDGKSIIRVNIAEVAAAAEAAGYSIYDVNVRVNIVPLGGTDFDYSITFDALVAE